MTILYGFRMSSTLVSSGLLLALCMCLGLRRYRNTSAYTLGCCQPPLVKLDNNMRTVDPVIRT
jgi:hypothetical protein